MRRISAIVPTLDEAPGIGPTVRRLLEEGVDEVVVVDGGSADETAAMAEAAGARVVASERGRGRQLDAGARVSRGEVLWFVHADTRVPEGALRALRGALEAPTVVAGAFRREHVSDHRLLQAALRVADLRSALTRHPYGDQAVFVRREAFEAVGGFRGLPLMEDLDLARRLRRIGRLVILEPPVRVSARRWTRRPLRTALTVWTFPMLYRLGVPAEWLVKLYPASR